MTHDQEIVRKLQRRVRGWEPDSRCERHTLELNCVYDELGRLIVLHLCGFELVQVFSEVWQCTSLFRLCLNANRLSSLPAQLGQLSSLVELSLGQNQLSSLPAEVCQLSSLQTLDMDGNQFSSLPTEVCQLSSLLALSLADNQLSSLPAEVCQLSSLRWLWLNDNQFRTLPAEVCQLSSLEILHVHNNRLSELPTQLSQLSSLKALLLYGNPLQSPPSDIIEQGTEGILVYLRTQLPSTGSAATRALPSASTDPQSASIAPSAVQQLRPIKIFYCYAHEDRDLRDRIDKHLGVLKRMGQVTGWYDREIQAGTEWEREIEAHLGTASLILLLVSADFVNSDYCYGVEMQKALEMHEKGMACVLPILLRPVDWQDAPFAKLQLLPTGAKPITRWSDPEEALEDVAKQIRTVVSTLLTHWS